MSNKGLPAMGFFVQRMGEIIDAEMNRNYHYMFRLLISTSDVFHSQDRSDCEEARNQLEKYIEAIETENGRTFNHTLQLRSKRGSHLYNNGGREAKLKIIDMLWKGGYIDKAQFGSFYDPSKGRKSGKGI